MATIKSPMAMIPATQLARMILENPGVISLSASVDGRFILPVNTS